MNLLTVQEVQQQLFIFGSFDDMPSDYADANAAQKAKWLGRLNRTIERFFDMMRPALTYRRIDLPIYDGVVTLPRYCKSFLQCSLLDNDQQPCGPLLVYSKFFEFACACNAATCKPIARPINELAQTFRIPEAGFRLRLRSTETLNAYTFYGGTDANDVEYFDSVSLNITNGTTTTSRVWNTLPRMVKEQNDVGVEVYSVDADNVETLIAYHAPSETIPAYQQYRVPNWQREDDDTQYYARVLTALCFVRLVNDNDVVFPSSLGAIQSGLQALRYEEVLDDASARGKWADALSIIDSNKQQIEGESEIIQLDTMGEYAAAGTHPWLM